MSVVPIRPVFQDGQRLTAERLTQALEFLRTMLRRVLLAPLSSGVAGGFELSPTGGVTGDTLSIAPGLAIDGQGRLIVVPDALSFSITDIEAGAGVTVTGGTIIRICLAQTESAESDACSPLKALGVEEGYQVLFKAETFDEALFDVAQFFTDPNTVEAWGDLDPPFATPESACVTLGHLIFASGSAFTATPFFRDGVSPSFKYIRNTAGTPSILLNEANVPGGPLNPPGKFPAVSVPVTLLLGPNPVVVQPGSYMAVYPEAHFKDARGISVQATHVSRYNSGINAGQVTQANPGVFEFAGGAASTTNPIQSGMAGVSAVPIAFDPVNGPVAHAGEPLIVQPSVPGEPVRLMKPPAGSPYPYDSLVGVSAGPSYAAFSISVVPLARSGLIRVLVDASVSEIAQNSRLRAQSFGTDVLVVESLPGNPALVRAAQTAPLSMSPVEIFAWIL